MFLLILSKLNSFFMYVIKYLFFVLLCFLLITCQNRSNVREHIESEEMTGFNETEEVKDIYYRFPSPDEMLDIIDKEKLAFNDELPLPTDRANQFLDSKSQALNLGVYIADLAYITLFQRQKEALTYFQVVYGLSDKLRISSAFDPSMLKRFEDNLNNLDSLKTLSDEALISITNYLSRNDKERVFALISIGGFIESLYLAFQIVDEYSEENEIIQRICDQKLVLENLINFSLEFADDDNVSEAIKLIHPVRAVYNELVATPEATKVTKNDKGMLIIKGGEKIGITKEQYNKLREATIRTRKKITENLEN